ncbi:hypothetical protein G6F62_014467 [Rhizopus arrhizus]|nr:hypothetical protein G6F40_016222 [Rhizopus arrhizus]KAG1311225.1 hypothetical protein G6F62_014467 [Rhizopus arrhizus]
MSSPRITTLCPGSVLACSTSTTVALRISRSARSAAEADSGATATRTARDSEWKRNMDSILVSTRSVRVEGVKPQRTAPYWRSSASMSV